MNFDESAKKLKELHHKRINHEEDYTTNLLEFNEVYINLINTSVNEKRYFSSSTLEIYIIYLDSTLARLVKESIEFDEIEFIQKEYLAQTKILNTEKIVLRDPFYASSLNDDNYKLFKSILSKRIDYIETLLYKKGIEVIKKKDNSIPVLGWNGRWKYSFKRNLKIIIENINNEVDATIKDNSPKHENIFCNNGFELFEHILKEYVKPKDKKGRKSDLIFYQRKMYDNKPQYIHQRPTEFFYWFENNYDEVFGQLKTLSQVENSQRNKDYSNALEWFKLQNK